MDFEERHQHEALDATAELSDPSPKTFLRRSVPVALASVSALATAACGGGGSSPSGTPVSLPGPTPTPTAAPTPTSTPTPTATPTPTSTASPTPATSITPAQRAIARALLHASIAISPELVDQVAKQGFESWLDREMQLSNDFTAAMFFERRNYDAVDSNIGRGQTILDPLMWSELMAGGNPVRKKMALALSQIFVVSMVGLNIVWPSQAIGEYWDILNKHAFGNYRDLLEAITLSPVMGAYLNMKGSQRSNPSTGRMPDENFAREIMQLFSIGLVQLNIDGTPKLSNGAPIEFYTNADIEGLSKAFTGWDLDYTGVALHPPPTPGRPVPDVKLVRRPMTSDPLRWNPQLPQSTHSMEEKRFLGVTISAGTGSVESMKIALDAIAAHPNVGPFIGRQLIQRLVSSNPSPAYVQRVASVFNNNGKGVRGDLGAVFRAIIVDPEANDTSNIENPYFGKVREPMLRFAQWGRTFLVSSETGEWKIRDLSIDTLLAQAPFRSPSVFNFYRPSYVPTQSQAAANNMVAPEFQIADETTVATYVNFMVPTVEGRGYWFEGIKPDYRAYTDVADDPQKLIDRIDLALTAGQLSEFTRSTVLSTVNSVVLKSPTDTDGRLKRVYAAVSLIMCSNDYIVQK